MNLKQKNAIAAATQDLLTHHLNSFSDFPVPMSVEADPLQPSMRAAEVNGPTFVHAIVSTNEIVAALAEQAYGEKQMAMAERRNVEFAVEGGVR